MPCCTHIAVGGSVPGTMSQNRYTGLGLGHNATVRDMVRVGARVRARVRVSN